MTQPVVALLGISGVGKSTVLNKLAGTIAFQHVQASTIIKSARDAQVATQLGVDELRSLDIDDNQALLISGFAAARDPAAPVVVLDGHSVIDTPQGLICIPPIIFAQLGVSLFVFLADDAAAIADRRRQDQTRRRPTRTSDELERHQNEALRNTFAAARLLNAPLMVFSPTQVDAIRAGLTLAAGMRIA